jgi:tRNA A37 methylthiotransferase MiaB
LLSDRSLLSAAFSLHNPRASIGGTLSLGCAKNLADAEIMLGTLLKNGMEITNDAGQADVLIINTCSFIDAAQKESVEAILESARARAQSHPGQGLIVAGCLPQRFAGELPKALPEVDAFMGVDQVAQVAEIVRQALAGRREKLLRAGKNAGAANSVKTISRRLAGLEAKSPSAAPGPVVRIHRRPSYIPDYATPRFRLTPRHFAYVKIAEGCNHPCSFCIIPQMRGAHRSRPPADVVREAAQLVAGRHEGTEPHFPGLHLLRPGPAGQPQPRHFLARKIQRGGARAAGPGPHAGRTAARAGRPARRFLGAAALHPSGPLDG